MIRKILFSICFLIVAPLSTAYAVAPMLFDLPVLVDRADPLVFERLVVPEPGRTSADREFTVANQPDQPWRRAAEYADPGWLID